MKEETKGWFDCLNAVAIEIEADKSSHAQDILINVLIGADITMDEVIWAEGQDYVTLDKSNVLNFYEGFLMEKEEREDGFA